MGHVLLAGKESYKRPALLGDMIADRPAEHRIPCFERVENRTLCYRSVDLKLNLAFNVSQGSQMEWQHDADHGSVWTSTETTGGKCCAIGAQVSPPLAEA